MSSQERGSELLDYEKELHNLDDLQQLMMDVDDQIKESRLRSELLNLDVVTMFDPDQMVKIRELSANQECVACRGKDDLDETIRES